MSYTKLIIHIVIRTKASKATLSINNSEELYRYIWGFLRNKNSVLYRINGVEDHIHILCSLPPTIALSDLMRDLKAESSKMLKRTSGFESFDGWGEGYAAVSCGENDKDRIVQYIKNQREHHKKFTFREEYENFLKEMGLELDERDWNR